MKLSSSLLAVCGVYADYACCPYNDFGVPDSTCTGQLSERTAWANADEQSGLTENSCKAWEANSGAAINGNEESQGGAQNESWGGCGFQRHFPWDRQGLSWGVSSNYVNHLLQLGGGTTTDWNSLVTQDSPFGKVALDGVCKLFVPVDPTNIRYVTVAGVHMRGGGISTAASSGTNAGCGAQGCSVFASNIQNGSGNSQTGTSFCFSVVNNAEGYTNTNGIANGNVAGGSNDLTAGGWLVTKSAWTGYGNTFNGGGNSAGGANFDVVVHMKEDYCASMWTGEDMQSDGFTGSKPTTADGADFDINSVDVWDKRFVDTGFGNAGAILNTYAMPGGHKWPNLGAWAGYYSHVSCAGSTAGAAATAIYADAGGSEVARALVVSNFNMDYRHDHGRETNVSIRGNVRQTGTTVNHCMAGALPPSGAGAARCSFNWNYAPSATDFWGANVSNSAWGNFGAGPNSNDHNAVAANIAAVQGGDAGGAFDPTDPTSFTFSLTLQGTRDMGVTGSNDVGGAVTNWRNDFNPSSSGPLTMDCSTVHGCSVSSTNVRSHSVTVPCQVRGSQGTEIGNTGSGTHPKDSIADCFQGDELWFEITVNGAYAGGADTCSSWFSIAQ